jgi:hypothetical protein
MEVKDKLAVVVDGGLISEQTGLLIIGSKVILANHISFCVEAG